MNKKRESLCMSEYTATIRWQRGEQAFADDNYSRGHSWEFDGGAIVPASASPDIVPVPLSVPENVDPEEAFVASISSCHMLFFLSIAARRGFIIDEYTDNPCGIMSKTEEDRVAMTRVTLHPAASYSGVRRPTADEIDKMHHRAHELCFIANSVKTEIYTVVVS
jgi:organic hydroperoxide reductase OsmC/OhrA